MTTTLSNELQRALDQSGGQPIRLEDPRTRKAYVLVEWNIARTWIETHRKVDGDWSEEKNARRCELIRKKFADGLTPAETAELDQLQEQVGQFREQFGPLAADTVRALEAELQRTRGPQSGHGASGGALGTSAFELPHAARAAATVDGRHPGIPRTGAGTVRTVDGLSRRPARSLPPPPARR